MTAENLPPWARMSLGYDDDPAVAKLARFGEDAGLCRDLHLAMIRYSRRNGTDGWVPPLEPGRLAWPLPFDRAMMLVRHLVEVELVDADGYDLAGAIAGGKATAIADAMAAGTANGWRVPNYAKWQETRGEVEAYASAQAERGRLGAAKRWKREPARRAAMAGAMAGAERVSDDQATWHPDGDPMAEREVERDLDLGVQVGDQANLRNAREAEDGSTDHPNEENEEDELDILVQALMFAKTGRSVSRIEALSIRQTLLSGRNVRDRAAYLRSALSTRKDARQFLPTLDPPSPPPSNAVLRPRVDKSAAAGRGAAEARRLMAEKAAKDAANDEARQAPEPPEPVQEPLPVPVPDDDPGEPPGEGEYPF